jgi:hypothetical protein
MNPPLPQQQLNEIRQELSSGTFLYESAMQKLIQSGLDEGSARDLLLGLAKQQRKELFDQTLKKQNAEGVREVTFMITFMVAVIGPVFEIKSALWYFVAMLVAAVCGYYGFKNKAIAGIAGSILLVILLPLTYQYYFSGRSSYIKIELLIPALLALIPAAIVAYLISILVYPERKNTNP